MPCSWSITVAVVLATVTSRDLSVVSAKLGAFPVDDQPCCSSTGATPSLRVYERESDDGNEGEMVIDVQAVDKMVVLKPLDTVGREAERYMYEWSLSERTSASIMFAGESWRQRDSILVGLDSIGGSTLVTQSIDLPPLSLKIIDRTTNATRVRQVRVRMQPDDRDTEAVELLLAGELFEEWTVKDRGYLIDRLSSSLTAATLSPEKTRIVVVLHELARLPLDGRWRLVAHVEERDAADVFIRVASARVVLSLLRSRVTTWNELKIQRAEMLHCSLSCSGHGTCDSYTKRCVCDSWWMPSFLSLLRSGGRVEDCSWSATNVFSFSLVAVATVGLLVMATRKHKSRRALLLSRRAARRRQRYDYLRSEEDGGGVGGGTRRSSRMRKRAAFPSIGSSKPSLVALPPRAWSSSSMSSDENEDLIPIRRAP